jgi:hypothetical protein
MDQEIHSGEPALNTNNDTGRIMFAEAARFVYMVE